MNLKGKKLVFLGDSITEGVGVSDINNTYWKLFERNDGCEVRGYGIRGRRIAEQQVKNKIDPSCDDNFRCQIPEMDADADIVVVFGGTNDYGHGDAAMGKMSDRNDDTFYGALHNLYSDLMKKYSEAQIVVMTPCHRLDEEEYYNANGIRNVGTLKDYVDAIIEVAAYYGIPVLDLYRLSGIQPEIDENRKLYIPDGLHPSDKGHEIICSRLKEFILRL